MNATAIWVIATNTFRQTVRQRLFYNVAVFGVGMVLLSMVVGALTFGYPDRVVRSIGLSGVSLALNAIALLISAGLVHQEIDRKTLFVVLARPVRRWQYVLGRYLGLVFALAATLAGLSAVFFLALTLAAGEPLSTDFMALGVGLIEAAIIGAIGVVLSCFSTPMLSAGIGIGVWIAGATTDDFMRLAEKAGDPAAKAVATAAYYVLPALSRFNFRDEAIYQTPIALADVSASALYGVCYAMALVVAAGMILSRREMN